MSKTQLHQILAVEESVNKTYAEALREAADSFSKKEHLFKGLLVSTRPLEEGTDGHQAVFEDTERTDVAETVPSKLTFLMRHATKAFNVYAQKEATNQLARADLVVNGEVLVKDCPATFLLGLEARLRSLRATLESIKTTDQSKGWVATDQPNVFQCRPVTTRLTKKVMRHKVVIEPTEHQAGQFTQYTEDIPVGEKTTTHFSGLISPKEKSDLLARLDVLLRAAKKARQKANTQEVVTSFKPGKVLSDFLLGSNELREEDLD